MRIVRLVIAFAAVFTPAHVYAAAGPVLPQTREDTKRKAAQPGRAHVTKKHAPARIRAETKRKRAHALGSHGIHKTTPEHIGDESKRKSAQPVVLQYAADETVPL